MEAMEANIEILNRLLPKTGQTTVYQTNDDGTKQAGWWKGLLVGTNKTRFIAIDIGGDIVVLDRATGLTWAADANGAGCNNNIDISWGDAIIYAQGLDFAGFTDWRLPNILELASIIDFGIDRPTIKTPPFINSSSVEYWSSTTYRNITGQAYGIFLDDGTIRMFIKVQASRKLRACRGGL